MKVLALALLALLAGCAPSSPPQRSPLAAADLPLPLAPGAILVRAHAGAPGELQAELAFSGTPEALVEFYLRAFTSRGLTVRQTNPTTLVGIGPGVVAGLRLDPARHRALLSWAASPEKGGYHAP